MWDSLLGGSMGAGYIGNAQQQAYNPFPGALANAANGGANQLANMQAQAQSALLQRQYQQAQMNAYQKPNWVIDGQVVSFEEFTDRLFPEDTPEKTVFLLRYAK